MYDVICIIRIPIAKICTKNGFHSEREREREREGEQWMILKKTSGSRLVTAFADSNLLGIFARN